MSSNVDTLYGANIDALASATDCPRSNTSGAVLFPFCWFAALIWSFPVVRPVWGQGDHVQFALLLRGLNQRVHATEVRGRGGLADLHTGLGLVRVAAFSGGAHAASAATSADAAVAARSRDVFMGETFR